VKTRGGSITHGKENTQPTKLDHSCHQRTTAPSRLKQFLCWEFRLTRILRTCVARPKIIREEFYSGSSNLWTEDGIDLGRKGSFHDAGDVTIPDDDSAAFAAIEAAVKQVLDLGHPLICLSGDHSVTYPTIKAFHTKYPDLTILHFDAHPDLYDELDGNRLSHACPFARIMEGRLARRLVQVGVRTINSHQLAQASRFGVEVVTMRSLERFAELKFEGPLYFTRLGRTRSGIRAGDLAL
jgi:arginase